MAVIKFTNSKSSVKKIYDYITKDSKTEEALIKAKDCMAETALIEMEFTKNIFKKNNGRQYIHIVQSFDPKDELTHEKANEIGLQLAEYFEGFQAVIATHKDRDHIHNHILLNSVNFKTGYKFQQSKKDMQLVKDYSDKLCLENNLSIIDKPKSKTDINRNEYQTALKGESWKMELILTIDKSILESKNKQEFISNMNSFGYGVNWTDGRKNITYTTPDGKKCRDSKLHDDKYLKECMEYEFREIEANTHREAGNKQTSSIGGNVRGDIATGAGNNQTINNKTSTTNERVSTALLIERKKAEVKLREESRKAQKPSKARVSEER